MRLISRFTSRVGDLAFLLVVLAGYVAMFINAPDLTLPEVVALILLGIVYVFIGTAGFERIATAGTRSAVFIYFAIQFALGTTILLLSRQSGLIGFCMLPLSAHAVVTLPRRGVWVVSLLTLILLTAPFAVSSEWDGFLQVFTAYGAGLVFVVGFTQIAQSEEKARAEVERLADELSEANQKLREYAAQVEDLATTKERNRLAREIHDGLGHYLTAINMQLQAARAVLDVDRDRAANSLGKAQTLTQEALTDVRRSVAALRSSPVESRPLPEALSVLVGESRAAGISTELSVSGAPRTLTPQAGLALYRAAQEGLTNVRKHAQASRADVTLDYGDSSCVRLTVRDDGTGADDPDGGFGLLGLRERVHFLGGEMRVETAAGQGFTLEVRVPG